MAFQMSRHQAHERKILKLIGELDTPSAALLDQELVALTLNHKDLYIDLAGLEYINSTGVRSFLRIVRRLRDNGGDLHFLATPAKIERVFQYCGLHDYFRFQAEADRIALQ